MNWQAKHHSHTCPACLACKLKSWRLHCRVTHGKTQLNERACRLWAWVLLFVSNVVCTCTICFFKPVKPVLSSHPRGMGNWLLNTGLTGLERKSRKKRLESDQRLVTIWRIVLKAIYTSSCGKRKETPLLHNYLLTSRTHGYTTMISLNKLSDCLLVQKTIKITSWDLGVSDHNHLVEVTV